MHFDSNYFPDPYKFDPERFSPDGNIIPFTFYPFGEGPRGCLGFYYYIIYILVISTNSKCVIKKLNFLQELNWD